jgi:hypothetical protein
VGNAAAGAGITPDVLDRFDRLIASQPGVERRGASMPYTSLNGHMFAFVSPTGMLALRLPAADREAFIARFGTTLHVAHGTVMKEYVTVPDDLFADPAALAPYFRTSYAYVAGLKPKAARHST